MGRITINIPQQTERTFDIRKAEIADRLISKLDEIVRREKDEEDDILGIWSTPRGEASASKPA